MNPGHPLDLRRRIVACVESGVSRRAAARRFAVSASSVIRLMQKWEQTGSLEPARVGGHRRRILADRTDWLHAVMAAEPDITLSALQARLSEDGVTVSLQTIYAMLKHLGYRFRPAIAVKRRRWQN